MNSLSTKFVFCSACLLRNSRWSSALEAKAEQWANNLKQNHDCGLKHDGSGENLYGAGDLNFNRLIPGTIRSVYRSEGQSEFDISRNGKTNVRSWPTCSPNESAHRGSTPARR